MSDAPASWTDPFGKIWTVGARVLWAYGRRDYAEFGAFGTIEAVPATPDADSGLMVRLQPASESSRERAAIDKRRRAGEDVTRVVDFYAGGHLEHGLTTVRDAYLVNAARFEALAKDWREMAEDFDELGMLVERERKGVQDVTLLDVVIELLRASADVHEAERIPHLVGPLREIAIALERGGLVPGPPPGRCGSPGFRIIVNGEPQPPVTTCDLRAGHAGQHEARYYPPVPGLESGILEHWSDPQELDVERVSIDMREELHAREQVANLRTLLAEVSAETPDGESPWLWSSDVRTILDGPKP
jgi:hypothetical protein